MSMVRTMAEVIATRLVASGSIDAEVFTSEIEKKGLKKEPTFYTFRGIINADPLFRKARCGLSVDQLVYLFRMYNNMQKRGERSWVRPLNVPITEESARDIWYTISGEGGGVSQSRLDSMAKARDAKRKKREEAQGAAEQEQEPEMPKEEPEPVEEPKQEEVRASTPPPSREETEAILSKIRSVLDTNDDYKARAEKAESFIAGVSPLLNNLESWFEMGKEEVTKLRSRLVEFETIITETPAPIDLQEPMFPAEIMTDECEETAAEAEAEELVAESSAETDEKQEETTYSLDPDPVIDEDIPIGVASSAQVSQAAAPPLA